MGHLENAVRILGMLGLQGELAWAQLLEAELATRCGSGTTVDAYAALAMLAAEVERTTSR